jgi:hypothetical protein
VAAKYEFDYSKTDLMLKEIQVRWRVCVCVCARARVCVYVCVSVIVPPLRRLRQWHAASVARHESTQPKAPSTVCCDRLGRRGVW